jgi:SNF2 family DNA or RNA helicase
MQGLSQSVGVEEKKSKCLIFSEFAQMCKILHREFPNSLIITGETPQVEREKIINEFRNNPDRQILIGTSALEMGVNLQCAGLIVHYDPPLTWSAYDQRCSRAHRHGRTDKVVSVRMVSKIEPKLYKLIETKQLISLSAMPYSVMKDILE